MYIKSYFYTYFYRGDVMIGFIRDSSILNLKKKLQFLYILNVTDIIMTLLLYNTGLFKEVNFIIASFLDNQLLSLFIKIMIPGILLFLLYKRMTAANPKQLIISNYIITFAVICYLAINLLHLLWVIILPSLTLK